MTGKEFSQKPFSFPRGTKVLLRYTSIGKGNKDDVKEAVCFFYGIKPIYNPCSANAEDFAPVFRAVAKNGKMSNKRPAFDGISGQLFSTIVTIDFADTDEKIRVWIEKWGKEGVIVCNNCGSIDIQNKAWVDSNTGESVSDADFDTDDNWCGECEQHGRFTTLEDFERKMDGWFNGADFKTMEKMFGLRHEDFDEEDGYQAFVDTCETRWDGLSYEGKRGLYNANR